MSTKKSAEFLPKIVEAKTKDDAILILNEVLEALHFSVSYTKMVRLRDRLEHYQKEFNSISKKVKEILSTVSESDYEQLNGCRFDLNFLYRDIVDELSADINFNKINLEEAKTTRRAESMSRLKKANEFGAKSASALRDIVGSDEAYKSYETDYALAYSNFKTMDNLLNSIRMMVDSIASRERKELTILQKDVK